MNLELEINHTLRLLRKNKIFVSLCILVIALGIAQSLMIFQVINNQILRTLPFPNGDKFVVFSLRNETSRESYSNVWDAYQYQFLKQNAKSYSEMGATQVATLATISDGESTETFTAAKLTSNLLDFTKVNPQMGRLLLADDEQVGSEPVVLLSHHLWQNYYASDPNIVNSRTRINGVPHTVVGVMPEDFRYPVASDLWLPLTLPNNPEPGVDGANFTIVAMLKNGVEREAAGREATRLMQNLSAEFSYEYKDTETKILPFTRQFFNDEGVLTLSKLLFAILILIVALSSINVGNLLLVRANERNHELAVRGALGATRFGLIRNILMESSFICFIGAVLGIVLSIFALWGTTSAQAGPDFMGEPFWINYDLELDVIILAFVLMLIIWVLAGGIPAFRASRIAIYETLASGTKHAGSKKGNWFVMMLITFELFISVFILITNGVTITSLKNEFAVDYGIKSDTYLTASISLPASSYKTPEQRQQFMDNLRSELLSNGSVKQVTYSNSLPSQNMSYESYNLEDRDVTTDNKYPERTVISVDPNYFDVMNISLLEGRYFTRADNKESLPVAVIDEYLAEILWPDESNILSKRIQLDPANNGEWLTIVGIIKNPVSGRPEDASDPRKAIYRPMAQGLGHTALDIEATPFYVMLEVNGAPDDLHQSLKVAAQNVDRDVPVFLIKSLTQVLEESVFEFEQLSILLTMIGVIALVLAASGIFAIMSRSVMLRTRDISIRRALGLTNEKAIRSFVNKGIVLLVIGCVFGGLLSLLAINALLSTTDIASLPLVFIGVIVVVSIIMFCATYFPAKKIVSKEPGDTLQES
ncbi:ABC transporter permease [Alteromonas sp. a30]|uniref:ABC transporter permease n=1 Tax=Alteromonas sp. a30 TaxID=2730917 RepID=UPI002281B202|nr:ABC transporter permease [Alteromonas sp. a30]MCY7295064.1 FtsX-like permease family protein [Alteromonas sp. a30]